MKKLILTLFLIVAAGLPLRAQNYYMATANTTAMTIQQPATDPRTVQFPDGGRVGASVYCAAAQTATLSWNGTAATSTAGTILLLPPATRPASATIWTASNAGSGTTGPVFNVIAGQTFSIDLAWFKMGAAGTQNNLTITTSGTCTITIMWSER